MAKNSEELYDDDIVTEVILEDDKSARGREVANSTEIDKKWKEALIPVYDYVDFNDSTVFLVGEIHEQTLFDVIARIRAILYARPEEKKNDPINLFINSPGGNVYEAFGIIDYLNTLPVKVNTICRGIAASAAALLLVNGTGQRVASKNSTIMVHEISSFSHGTTSNVKSNTKHLEWLEDVMYKMLGEKTKKDIDFWKKEMSRDYYLSPEQALELGVIDKII